MKTKIIITLAIMWGGNVFSQQLSQYSQYFRNPYSVNPAAAGMFDYADLRVVSRSQWVGFKNAPLTSNIYFTMPVTNYRSSVMANHTEGGAARESQVKTGIMKHAAGGRILIDQYGAFRKLDLAGSYAVHIPFNKKYNMSFGTSLGISSNTFLNEKAVTLNPDQDNTYSEGISDLSSKGVVNLGVGFAMYSKSTFGGIAIDQITKEGINFGNATSFFDTKTHFIISGGQKIEVDRDFSITPSVLWKYMRKSPLSLDVSMVGAYKDWIWASVSYRYKDAIMIGAGYNVSQRFRFSYSYDITTSKIRKFSSGSHELTLCFMFDRK